MVKFSSPSIGLSAYLIMQEKITKGIKYLGFNLSIKEFEFESDIPLHEWETRYDLSSEKPHDSIVMRLRKYKK